MRFVQNSLYFLIPFLVLLLLFIYWQAAPVHLLTSSFTKESLPTFNLPTLYHSEKSLTNRDLKGAITLINFWASWCAICQKEHSVLMKIKQKYPWPIIGINIQDKSDLAKKMLKQGNPYQVVAVDYDGLLASDLDIQALPQTLLVDKHGVIRYRYRGALTFSVWENRFLPLIEEIKKE